MTRYLGMVRMEEGISGPPQALMDAMDDFIAKSAAAGVFVDGGGLYGTEDAVNFVIEHGGVTEVDGPYAEAKEIVGGWSLLEFATQEAAVDNMREMAQLHADHWPDQKVVITLRQVAGDPGDADQDPSR